MKKLITKNEAIKLFANKSEEIAVVVNPKDIYPEYELYPLARKLKTLEHFPVAVVMDMDGTTTTTEELCLHSLEYAIRKMSGLLTLKDWKGLDHGVDYPHVIGNSTTKHIEYLVSVYSTLFKSERVRESFLFSSLWTVFIGVDQKRREEAEANLKHFGYIEVLSKIRKKKSHSISDINLFVGKLIKTSDPRFQKLSTQEYVKIAIDVYYQRYHEILTRIKNGESEKVAQEIFGSSSKRLIEPMHGVLFFLAMIRGWLGDEIVIVYELLKEEYKKKSGKIFTTKEEEKLKKELLQLSMACERKPLKVALVTSSIRYEAEIVMYEVFNVIKKNILELPFSKEKKQILKKMFSQYSNIYDAFVTASDSHEIRLKPHRDLYSIALQQLHIRNKEYGSVVGFEDSESGTIAMRAAGIGLAVAVPFAQTKGHDLSAASYICYGGLPEVILKNKLFTKVK